MGEMTSFIRQYGLQRSGTCYTQFLFESNFDVKVLNREPDKHTPPTFPPDVPSVLSVKHPFSWSLSIWAYWRKRQKKGIPTKFKTFCITAALPLWNKRMAQFLAMAKTVKTLAVVRSEDLLNNSKNVITTAAETFELERTSKKWVTSNKAMRPIHGGKPSSKNFDHKKYTRKLWLEKYSKELLLKAQDTVDERLMRVFEYKMDGGH